MGTTTIAYQTILFEELNNVQFLTPVRSPLNYIGGKFKLIPQILPLFPHNISTFVDLFCGGCNIGINVNAEHIIFNDNIIYLIDLYKSLKNESTTEIIKHIKQRIKTYNLSLTNSAGYLELRELYNRARNPLDLFVLIAYSFNHQIRFNSSHQFNNPFGKERSSFNPTMENNLIEFINKLHKISCEFHSQNFDKLDLSILDHKDLVYCDPPYLITTGTYNDGKRGFTGWSEKEECTLLHLLDTLSSRGVRFALSNVLTHKGKKNYLLINWIKKNNYNVHHLKMNYANSNYHTSDRSVYSSDEVLITNYLV